MKTCKSCQIDYDDAESYCKKCGNLLLLKNAVPTLNSARKLIFEKKIKTEPDNIDILTQYCNYLFENDSYNELVPYALKLIEHDVNNDVALFGKAYSLLKAKQLKPAIEIFGQLYARLGNHRLVQVYAAINFALNNNTVEGVKILSKLIGNETQLLPEPEKNRAFLYFSYLLSLNSETIESVKNTFTKINFEVLEDEKNEFDILISLQVLQNVTKHKLVKVTSQKEALQIRDLINDFLMPSQLFIEEKYAGDLADVFYEIAQKQESYKLFNESLATLQEAIKLSPENPIYQSKINILSESQSSNKKSGSVIKIVAGIVLFLVAGFALSYFLYFKQKWIDDAAPRYYTVASSSILRSSPLAGVDYNRIESLPYGTELILYSYDSEWSQVKAHDKAGYIASNIIVNKNDFIILNSIFGDVETRDAIETVKCRLALLNYFKKNNYIGKINESIIYEVFGADYRNKEVWQLFSKNSNIEPNTVIYPRVVNPNSKYTDFGVIINNLNTGDRKFLLFSFNDDQTAFLVHEEYAPVNASLTKRSVQKNTYFDEAYITVNYLYE